MSLMLYAHPFSSYSQKVLIALWEKDILFSYRHLEDEGVAEERAALWPLGKFPVLVDDEKIIAESSIIIEHLELYHPGATRLLPADGKAALDVRFMDRFFDHYVMTPVQKAVSAALRGQDEVGQAAAALETAYTWLEARIVGQAWAAGEDFGMADCAAAPALFYADWVHRIAPHFPALQGYRSRLLARPSFARAVEEARPYRAYFPLGAPARD